MGYLELEYKNVQENKEYEILINEVVDKCFEIESLRNFYIEVTLTTPENIKAINEQYRNIDKATDVLSFPMFEKDEIKVVCDRNDNGFKEVLGNIVISIKQVEIQAKEYGHSFERELAYMVVHGFYHLMGYDHMIEEDKKIMRAKEENVLSQLKISR